MIRWLPRIIFIWFKNIKFNCVDLFDLGKHFCNFIEHWISKQSGPNLESESSKIQHQVYFAYHRVYIDKNIEVNLCQGLLIVGLHMGLSRAMVCWTAGRYLPEGTSPKKKIYKRAQEQQRRGMEYILKLFTKQLNISPRLLLFFLPNSISLCTRFPLLLCSDLSFPWGHVLWIALNQVICESIQ